MHPNMYFPPQRPIRPEASHANINIPRCPNKWGFVFVISHCGNSSVTSSVYVCTNSLLSPVELWTLMIWVCLEFWGRFSLLNVVRRGSLSRHSIQAPWCYQSNQIKIRLFTPSPLWVTAMFIMSFTFQWQPVFWYEFLRYEQELIDLMT